MLVNTYIHAYIRPRGKTRMTLYIPVTTAQTKPFDTAIPGIIRMTMVKAKFKMIYPLQKDRSSNSSGRGIISLQNRTMILQSGT